MTGRWADEVVMHGKVLGFMVTLALVALGCAAANSPSSDRHGSQSSLHQDRCRFGDNISELTARLVDRGCSKEVASGFATSFMQVASRRWDPQTVMRRMDPTAHWLGGTTLRSLLRVSLSRAGIVTGTSMDETFRRSEGVVRAMSLEADIVAEALDRHAMDAFAVGAFISPVPACGPGLDDLDLRLRLCLQVQRAANRALLPNQEMQRRPSSLASLGRMFAADFQGR
jgi:hypothetical protein